MVEGFSFCEIPMKKIVGVRCSVFWQAERVQWDRSSTSKIWPGAFWDSPLPCQFNRPVLRGSVWIEKKSANEFETCSGCCQVSQSGKKKNHRGHNLFSSHQQSTLIRTTVSKLVLWRADRYLFSSASCWEVFGRPPCPFPTRCFVQNHTVYHTVGYALLALLVFNHHYFWLELALRKSPQPIPRQQ